MTLRRGCIMIGTGIMILRWDTSDPIRLADGINT